MAIETLVLVLIFILGYCGIVFESRLTLNKGAVALLLSIVLWSVAFTMSSKPVEVELNQLSEQIGSIAQIIFFLMGGLAIVELVDSHHGFQIITRYIRARSKRRLLVMVSISTFFLSAILDNLTTTVLMISLLRKIVPDRAFRFSAGVLVVVAANAGGAWSPIGDVTTTMLWIGGQISSITIMQSLLLPSLCSLVIPLLYFLWREKGVLGQLSAEPKPEKGAKLIFTLGILALLSVPVFKAATGLPPFMGMLVAVAVLWIVTDLLHARSPERQHLRVPSILMRIDLPSLLFFLGILLAVASLETSGVLQQFAEVTSETLGTGATFAGLLGLASAIIDNIPLVAATIGMYSLTTYPIDSQLWHLIAYAAGTGGSLLIIGSAAGVAFMALEKVDFIAYLKKATLPVLFGYLAGLGLYLLLS